MAPLGRVFCAVPLPPEMRLALADRLGEMAVPGRVAPAGNWHLTLRFLGAIDLVTYERFLGSLHEVESVAPFPIRLTGFGAFPNTRMATVFWAGIGEGESELGSLNQMAERAAQDAGLEPEERPFRAHLTLSRIRPPADVTALVAEPLDLRWRCASMVVYRSRPGDHGVIYEPLESFTLIG